MGLPTIFGSTATVRLVTSALMAMLMLTSVGWTLTLLSLWSLELYTRTGTCSWKFAFWLLRFTVARAWMLASSCSGPSTTTVEGDACSVPLAYPTGGGLVIVIVTATDLDVKTSTSTCSVVGGSMSSMFGSLLVIVMGIEYVPP